MNMVCWNVFLHGKWIDAVYYDADCTHDHVKSGLINHDGYHPNIKIKRK